MPRRIRSSCFTNIYLVHRSNTEHRRSAVMKWNTCAASAILATIMLPLGASAQDVTHHEHERAKHVQERHDARHHTKAKIVGGSAVGGAVVGGLVGGGKGAVIGAGVGAGGGLLANHERKQHDIHKREHCEDA